MEEGNVSDAGRGEPGEGGSDRPRYQRLSEIGRGGMGQVLRVEDPVLEREVAMKVAVAAGQASEEILRRFVNEAKVTAQLDHPNIPSVHDLGKDEEGKRFFTMKLVRGKNLGQLIEEQMESGGAPEGGEWTLNRFLDVFLKACDAVAFAHDKNVIHRDLKPENVMVGGFGEVYVMDWGLSKILSHAPEPSAPDSPPATAPADAGHSPVGEPVPTRIDPASAEGDPDGRGGPGVTVEGSILGTPSYMSPEAADGRIEGVDRQSDVYSLGALLYEILTFEKPVEGSTVAEVIL
ncbi:MAG: serine/threonine-protein kinase, partial [Planctomycetota bacterium]